MDLFYVLICRYLVVMLNRWHTDDADKTDIKGCFFVFSYLRQASVVVSQWHTDDADRTDLIGSFSCL